MIYLDGGIEGCTIFFNGVTFTYSSQPNQGTCDVYSRASGKRVNGGVGLIVSKKMERMMDGETGGPKPSLGMQALTNNRNFQDSEFVLINALSSKIDLLCL